MTLAERISTGLKEAMKNKDEARKRTIRAIKAQLLLLKTDGSGDEITEEKEIQLLQRMLKQREDSLAMYQSAADSEKLAAIEAEEIVIIKEFLPQMLSEQEIEQAVAAYISELGAQGMKDMGKIMGKAREELGARADGKTLSAVVKRLLTS